MTRDLIHRFQDERRRNETSAGAEQETKLVTIEIENDTCKWEPFRLKVQQIRDKIEELERNTQSVREVHALILASVDTDDKHDQLDLIMADIKSLTTWSRSALDEIRAETEKEMQVNSTTSRMKLIQHQSLTKLFTCTLSSYNEAQMEYREKCKQRIKRQLTITGKTLTDEDVEELLATGNFDVFSLGVIIDNEKTKRALADVQARHQDIMKLESSVRELRDLYIETALLVDLQGTMIDCIEYSVKNAAEFIEKAKAKTKTAYDNQKAARRKEIWLIAIFGIIIVIILLIIPRG